MAAPEATITQTGLANGAQGISYTLVEAVDAPGYIFKVSTTAGSMNKTTAMTDCPTGYNMKSSVPAYLQAMVQYVEGSAVAGVFTGIQAMIPGQEAYLQCAATCAITSGDFMAASAGVAGKVAPRSAAAVNTANAAIVFCQAVENKVAQAGGTIKVRFITPIYLPSGVTLT